MSIKPTDFFINVTDFFSVLLPGALVSYFLTGEIFDTFLDEGLIFPRPNTQLQGWLLFLLATYIIGHIIFMLGSLLMDKWVYDKFLRNTFFRKNFDLAYHTATLTRDSSIPTDDIIHRVSVLDKLAAKDFEKCMANPKREILNTYKWALHYLALNCPEVLVNIKKMEADSKFFRSLVIAFLFIGLALLFQLSWYALLFLVLGLLSVYRYGDLRYKSTQMAYELVITAFNTKKLAERPDWEKAVSNDVSFKADPAEMEIHRGAIKRIARGNSQQTELFCIHEQKTLKSYNTNKNCQFFCLGGRGIMNFMENRKPGSKRFLSPGAIVEIPLKSSIEITNHHSEKLLLVSVA